MRPEIPSREIVRATLDRGRVRLLTRDALYAVSGAALAGAAGVAVGRLSGAAAIALFAAAFGIAAGVVTLRRHSRTTARAALLIERADPSLKNTIITAEELIRYPGRWPDGIGHRVFDDASARLRGFDLRSAVPIARAAALAVAAVLIAVVAPLFVRSHGLGGSVVSRAGSGGHNPAVAPIAARLEPPAYSKRPAVVLTDPSRIEALDGTRLTLTTAMRSPSLRVRFGDRELSPNIDTGDTRFEMTLIESGYLAIEDRAARAGGEPARLIPVTVTPDRSPAVRVERPGRDLLLASASEAVEVAATASDDIALAALALRYTRVSGSGEQFEFVEGELPLTVTKESPLTWRGLGRIPVASLGLEPGDSLVYRVTARDERPGSGGAAASETFFVEIAGPGQVALEGFEMPPEQERYALSQQMIVVKLRRLRERERRLSRDALGEESGAIAAEQRAVRGNFIFLMGGHVEDEEEEAEQSHEIQEGRLENTARREIWRAVSQMTMVEQALSAPDTSAALAAAVKAVEALQRAFTRNRYILRTLPSRLRIDPSRRFSGDLDDVKDGKRPVAPAADPAARLLARQLLTEMIALVPALRSQSRSPRVMTSLSASAERALSAASADDQWNAIAHSLLRLRTAVSENAGPARVDAESRSVVQALQQRVRHDAARLQNRSADHLERAWAAEGRSQ